MSSEKCTFEYNTASEGYILNETAELSDDVGHCTTGHNEHSRQLDLWIGIQFGTSVSQVGMLLSLLSSDIEEHNLHLDFVRGVSFFEIKTVREILIQVTDIGKTAVWLYTSDFIDPFHHMFLSVLSSFPMAVSEQQHSFSFFLYVLCNNCIVCSKSGCHRTRNHACLCTFRPYSWRISCTSRLCLRIVRLFDEGVISPESLRMVLASHISLLYFKLNMNSLSISTISNYIHPVPLHFQSDLIYR
jgi:hypothetical protein